MVAQTTILPVERHDVEGTGRHSDPRSLGPSVQRVGLHSSFQWGWNGSMDPLEIGPLPTRLPLVFRMVCTYIMKQDSKETAKNESRPMESHKNHSTHLWSELLSQCASQDKRLQSLRTNQLGQGQICSGIIDFIIDYSYTTADLRLDRRTTNRPSAPK